MKLVARELVITEAMRFIVLLLALGWLILIGIAQATCSIVPWFGTQCHDPRLDVWLMPFGTAVFGFPAVIALTADYISRVRKNNRD